MVNRNLISGLDLSEEEWEATLNEAMEGIDADDMDWGRENVPMNSVVEGTVLRVDGDIVLVDVGYKSEGTISLHEWGEEEDQPVEGDVVKCLLEDLEDSHGMMILSKRKAEKSEAWQRVMESVSEGDVVTGMVTRKIKGGLLVDIGVNVFLPASQVDIRRPSDIGDYIGRTIQCLVLKIDESRRNIVVSRRALIEAERAEKKSQLLSTLEEGQVCKGVVKNIADFGAFVDLGGIDGLLHITDMSWGRISHPSKMVSIDDEIEVMILNIDREKEKIALGLKQQTPSPWENVADKYPVGDKVRGIVVNVMSYGAFVKLEEGIEGLVHISEMSWTKRINHPNELVHVDDEIDVVVLGINREKQEISLGMKQTQENPWDVVADKYPPGTAVTGTVRNLTNYGAFIEIEEGIDGLLHVSDMSWTRKISHPSEMVEKAQAIDCKVLSVDQQRRRIALGLKQLAEDPWANDIPNRYQPNQVLTGTVTKITNFGVFVGLENGLEGLLHISELADHKVENPEEIVKVGDEIEVKVLRVDTQERKIGLSRKRVEWAEEDSIDTGSGAGKKTTSTTTADRNAADLKGGIGGGSGLLIQPVTEPEEVVEESTEEVAEESTEVVEEPAEAAEEPTEVVEESTEVAEADTDAGTDTEEASTETEAAGTETESETETVEAEASVDEGETAKDES